MTKLEKLFIYWWGGIIWDRGGNFSKFIDPGSHWGAFHRGTWTGCVNSMRAYTGFSCTNYFWSIVLLIFAHTTTLNKFHFHSLRKKMINVFLVMKYHLDFPLQFDIGQNIFQIFITILLNNGTCNYMTQISVKASNKYCWKMYGINKCTIRLKMQHLWIVDFVFHLIPFVSAYLIH